MRNKKLKQIMKESQMKIQMKMKKISLWKRTMKITKRNMGTMMMMMMKEDMSQIRQHFDLW